MQFTDLFRPKQQATTARVRSSACRGYVVELDPGKGKSSRMVESPAGRTIHFRSLDHVRDALRRRGVERATLVQHHACEELSALGVSRPEESGVPLF
ncbi:DUF6482 family protein [Congregibacter sp.]|uniref:DUF6482 family protein n=1 Tax=Congregibacter sp. TaxID=2744308 RepID=UPI0039E6FC8F